jgi:RNA binding exosome subunit
MRTFVHATESREKVESAFKFVCGDDAEIVSSKTYGHYGNPIELLETIFTKRREIDAFFSIVINAARRQRTDNSCGSSVMEDCRSLSESRNYYTDEDFITTGFLSDSDIENRVDDDCVFYVRLDKQAAYNKMVIAVTHDDVIAVQAKIEAYPAYKRIAVDNLKRYLADL